MGEYTREIYLGDEEEAELVTYLRGVIFNHQAERSEHVNDLINWQKEYWAKPTTEVATFPFKGAATIVIPLDAIAVEAIHARNMTQRFILPQLVSCHPVNPDWEDAAVPFERFFNRELTDVMRIRKPLGDCYLEAEKFGTMIGKVGYEKLVRTSLRTIGDHDEEVDVTIRDGATFDAVSDSRFLMPHESRDPQTAEWCGEEHSETPYNVRMLELGGAFRPGTIVDGPDWQTDSKQLSKLHSWVNRTSGTAFPLQGNRYERETESLENTKPQWPHRIDWTEIWLAWDTQKSGRLFEIVVQYHNDSGTIMSIRYNPNSKLRRPYRTGVYFPVEHRWRGIGLCKMNEQFQKEVTVQHRQRIDNATLANMRMLKISKLSGYGPKEPVFPGKMWFLDDMSHVETIQMGEIYPSSFSNEQATLIYGQQRVGISELNLGQPQAGTPGTATSDLARIQEGNKKHDFIYQNFTEFTEDIFTDIASTIWQYGPRQVEYFDNAENGKRVKDVFQMPLSGIEDGLLLKIKASTQQHNRILDRQNWVQIAPLLQQYYQGLIQLAQLGGLQQIAGIVVVKGMNAATEAMRQILDSFDVPNVDRLVVKEIEDMLRNGLRQLGTQQGTDQRPVSSGQNNGMDFVTNALSLPGANGNGVTDRLPNR